MAQDRIRTRAMIPQALLPEYRFPDEAPDELLFGLNALERKFVRCYVESGDSHKAFRDSGLYHGQKRPHHQSYMYLRRPKIRNAIHRLQAFYFHHMGLHSSQVLGLLHSQATCDPMLMYQEDGDAWTVLPIHRWPLELRQCVQKLRTVERVNPDTGERTVTVEVEFADRQRALALLGKHLKLFERQEQTAPFTLVLNTNPEPVQPKQVGKTIDGIGLRINLPDE
jgi:hypothetical protein